MLNNRIESFDFTSQNRRPSVRQIIARWEAAGRPYEFSVEYGETWVEFRYSWIGWEWIGPSRRIDAKAVVNVLETYGKDR